MADNNPAENFDFELGFPLDAEYVSNQQAFMDEDAPIEVNIWLESLDDKRIWAPLFENLPKYNFNFLNSASFQAADGKSANGCNRLLKLFDKQQITLGKNQIFCLDSDFKFIKSLCHFYKGKDHETEHIYWTLVHSKENVHMFPSLVDETISHMTGMPKTQLIQKSVDIFNEFAENIFPPLTAIVFLDTLESDELTTTLNTFKSRIRDHSLILNTMTSTAKIEFNTQPEWITFTSNLSDLHSEILKTIHSLKLLKDYEKYLQSLDSAGIDKTNIYLFMRGHDLENIMCGIFNLTTEAYRHKTLGDIERSSPSPLVSRERKREFNNKWINFNICFKSRTPNYDQVPFFRENIEKIRTTYA